MGFSRIFVVYARTRRFRNKEETASETPPTHETGVVRPETGTAEGKHDQKTRIPGRVPPVLL